MQQSEWAIFRAAAAEVPQPVVRTRPWHRAMALTH
jgi:hypothetical protein